MRSRIVMALCLLAASLSAQSSPPLEFDVVSIKPNRSGSGRSGSQTLPGGGYTATNVNLRQLILEAYDLQSYQVAGGPDWLASDRFDVAAKPPRKVEEKVIPAMLRAMLADRFQLKSHREQRERSAYALVLARADGRLGPQIAAVARDCSKQPALDDRPTGALAEVPVCGMNTNMSAGGGTMRGGGRTMAEIAAALGNTAAGQPVVDRTGLTGVYDFELRWAADAAATGVRVTDDGSLFTALPEQLGLKLQSTRAAIDVLVVDSAEPPSAN